jgi:hypothetical protein
MVDTAGETVPCQYCGEAVEVPAGRTRFEAFTAHFEIEHVDDALAAAETAPEVGEGPTATDHVASEESGIGDD